MYVTSDSNLSPGQPAGSASHISIYTQRHLQTIENYMSIKSLGIYFSIFLGVYIYRERARQSHPGVDGIWNVQQIRTKMTICLNILYSIIFYLLQNHLENLYSINIYRYTYHTTKPIPWPSWFRTVACHQPNMMNLWEENHEHGVVATTQNKQVGKIQIESRFEI